MSNKTMRTICAVTIAASVAFAPPAIAADDAESYYAASFYLVGFLERAAVVCPSEEAVRTAKAGLDLFREPGLQAILRGFPKKTKRWVRAGAHDFDADIMKKGIGSACGDALEIRTGAEKLLRPE